jgi:hypothetical protein
VSYFASNHFESNHFASNYLSGISVVVDEGGGATAKKRRRGDGWAREREILERSLRPVAEEQQPEAAELPRVPTPQREVAGGQELLEESLDLQRQIASLEQLRLEGQISKLEYEDQIRRKNEAIRVILLALELDKRIAYEIIM